MNEFMRFSAEAERRSRKAIQHNKKNYEWLEKGRKENKSWRIKVWLNSQETEEEGKKRRTKGAKDQEEKENLA